MHAGLCLGGRFDTLAARGTHMDNFYNKNFKNNSTSRKRSRRFYSDSNESRTHRQPWEIKNRDINDRYFRQLNDSWRGSDDNFQFDDQKNQLIGRQSKRFQSPLQKTKEFIYNTGTSEEIGKQNFLNNFTSFASTATYDTTLVKDYESILSPFSCFNSSLASGYQKNPDCSRQDTPSYDLLKPNLFSESLTLPFQRSEDKTNISCSSNDFPTTTPSCSINNNQANENTELLLDERNEFPTFRFMNIRKRLGLCAAEHPLVTLSDDQLLGIKADILEKIFEPEGRKIRPRFFGAGIRNGYLVLVCGDNITVSWVKDLPKTLKVSGGGQLKVVEEPYDKKTFIAVGHFPKSDNDSNTRILKFLEIQNEGLDISKWKILQKNYEKNSAVRLTFSIDWMSAKVLKSRGPLLNYKFGGARFLLKTKRGVKFKQEESFGENDFDHESFEDFPLTPIQFPNPLAQPEMNNLKSEEFLREPEENPTPPDFPQVMNEYQAKVANYVERSKNSLRFGLTSKERFLMHKKNKRKKRKKRQIKVEPR